MSVTLVLTTVMPMLYALILSGASLVHVKLVMMEMEQHAMVTLISKSNKMNIEVTKGMNMLVFNYSQISMSVPGALTTVILMLCVPMLLGVILVHAAQAFMEME